MKLIIAAFAAALLSIGIASAAKPVCDAGTLDSSYGNGGSVALTQPYIGALNTEGILLDRKDRTVVLIDSPRDLNDNVTISLLRTTDKGVPDNSFGVGGRAVVTSVSADVPVATSLAEDPSGRILFLLVSNPIQVLHPIPAPYGNATLTVYRLLENGQPDMTFGNSGVAVINDINSVAIIVGVASDTQSRTLIALGATDLLGSGRIETTLLRLTAGGVLDSTFGLGGVTQAPLSTTGPERATDVQIQADGRILVLGRTHTSPFNSPSSPGVQNKNFDFYVMRFLPNGTLDQSYGSSGSTIISFGDNRANGRKGRIQPDGKLVIAGNVTSTGLTPDFPPYAAWVRLNTDGSLDTTFGSNGLAMINFGAYGGILFDLSLQTDGRIVGGVNEWLDSAGNNGIAGVMRINGDGTLDTSYAGDGVANFLPQGYADSAGGYLRVDSKNRTVALMATYISDTLGGAPFLARFEPGKKGWCK